MDTGLNLGDNRLLFNSVQSFKEWGNVSETKRTSIIIMYEYLNYRSISKHWETLMLQLATGDVCFDVIIMCCLRCLEERIRCPFIIWQGIVK